jgi:hypothetical protein
MKLVMIPEEINIVYYIIVFLCLKHYKVIRTYHCDDLELVVRGNFEVESTCEVLRSGVKRPGKARLPTSDLKRDMNTTVAMAATAQMAMMTFE